MAKRKPNILISMARFSIVVVLLITTMAGFVKVNEKKKEIEQLDNQIKEQQYENAQINDMLEANDLELIERYAREKLGYGYPNEKVYIDIAGK
ncbi:MAG: septum formation initiator family protein [Ruminococcaceae bacterium]|nr:septum formation initiator family protein [Oscillospiraceae bacterium]